MRYVIHFFLITILLGLPQSTHARSMYEVGFFTTLRITSLHKDASTSAFLDDELGNFALTSSEIFKLLGLMGFCFVTLVVVVARYRKSLKNDRHEYETVIQKTRQKLEDIRQKQSVLASEFEQSTSRLKNIVEQLESKRQELANIKQLVEMTSAENSISSDTKSKFSKIGRNIQYSFHVDQEWHHFRSYFENANEKFLSNLKQRFPGLSPNDYKLCVLYKTDSDHERVASIMEISPESARVMKHRLKKKLGLPLNVCLSEFLRGFDAETIKMPSHVEA